MNNNMSQFKGTVFTVCLLFKKKEEDIATRGTVLGKKHKGSLEYFRVSEFSIPHLLLIVYTYTAF